MAMHFRAASDGREASLEAGLREESVVLRATAMPSETISSFLLSFYSFISSFIIQHRASTVFSSRSGDTVVTWTPPCPQEDSGTDTAPDSNVGATRGLYSEQE